MSQVAPGGRARVEIDAYRIYRPNVPEWERDFLVVEEHLPAGHDPDRGLGAVAGRRPHAGRRRPDLLLRPRPVSRDASSTTSTATCPASTAPCRPRSASAYEPGRSHLGPAGDLKVLAPGEPATDPYKATPDELYARGKALFDAGRLAEAAAPLEALFGGYTLRDDVAKDAARMLLLIHIDQDYDARKVVQYFEVVKEKAPELVITFDDLLVIGRAYRDIGEYERAYLVWRGVTEASYLEDARVGEVLRQRGKTLEGIAYLIDLWRSYPDSAVDRERLLRPLAGPRPATPAQAITDPALPRGAGRGRGHPVRAAPAVDPPDPDRPRRSRPDEPAGRRGEPGPGRRLPRAGGLRGGRQALGPVRQALPQEHVPRQLPVQRGAGRLPPRPVRPGRRGRRDDRRGDLQGRRRRRPAEPEQVAGALHPRPDLRRPPPAGQGARATTSRSPTGSPTPPARSSR